jgi:hypothetical protein
MRTLIALGLGLAIATAGCAGTGTGDPEVATAQSGAATATASPSATAAADPGAPLKFSKCMREHGIAWFPDPDKSNRTSINVPRSQDKAKFDAAMEACKQWSPESQPHPANPEDAERMRNLAKCMRANGVPDFPDPKTDGSLAIDGDKLSTKPGEPTFDKAEKLCAQFIPEGATRERNTSTDDGGKGA